ncbi:hypothetical protein VTO42DRAFT_6286 [Malbranchea cinnamomea]
MSLFNTVKTLLIFFAPVLVPRAISYYRSFRASLAHRPSPRPLPTAASRALNILFCSTAFFLALSLPFSPHSPPENIFVLTSSRFDTPVDLLFSRLARLRPHQTLTPQDTLLRERLATVVDRKLYLRFGEDAIINCPFCSAESPITYLLYYLPFNIFIPHLFHLFILGLVTSAPLVGTHASRWRTKFVITGLSLVFLEIALVYSFDPLLHGPLSRNPMAIPQSLHNRLFFARFVVFAILDAVCAGLIYLSATNRLFYTRSTAAEQAEQLVTAVTGAVISTTSKLHALNVAKNAVVRDEQLKAQDEKYWAALREMETSSEIWKEAGVVRALNEAMRKRQHQKDTPAASQAGDKHGGSGDFVDTITAGLEAE